ncbi:MAG: hypothetical protein JO317_04405, partial [Verrucomicrobiae bacterium]|nr:hypothetical protein [Verrucomicrobiae bacterium]
MKSAAWKFLLILACAAPLSAATWSENFNPPAKGRWMRFGKTETTSAGVRLGPAPIDWDESGMRTSFAIGNPDHRVKLALEFEGFKVDKPSMKQADEDRENGDVSVNIQLSRDSQSTFYNSKHPSVLVNLFYNAQEQKFWGCVRAKGAGVPNSSGTC